MDELRTWDSGSLVCHRCIGNSELKKRLGRGRKRGICNYCGRRGGSWTIAEIAKIVDETFNNFYEPGEDVPNYETESGGVRFKQEGDSPEDIISILMDTEPEIASVLAHELSSSIDPDGNYVEANLNTHKHFKIWNDFRTRIKHGKRFYDPKGHELLKTIFDDIENFSFGGIQLPLRIIDPATESIELFRARRAANIKEARQIYDNPIKELSPPPLICAKAGRMNPAGIPVFYGAFDEGTCIAELRPTVGSFVVYGAFKLRAKVKLLDLSVFEKRIKEPNKFEKGVYEGLTRWKFLNSFHRQIIQPVQPEDEPIEYIPTQAVSEYIRNVLKYNGIIYSSTQLGKRKRNIVLFDALVYSGKKNATKFDGKFSEDFLERESKIQEFFDSKSLIEYIKNSVEVVRISSAQYDTEMIDDDEFPFL
jgi:hypothetical protein